MRFLADTNVLISAYVFGGGPRKLLTYLLNSGFPVYVPSYVDQEFHGVLKEKWPDRADQIYEIFHRTGFVFCESTKEPRGTLRDEKDIPVLSDAIAYDIDVIISGDKDFLEANLDHPMVCSIAMLTDFFQI